MSQAQQKMAVPNPSVGADGGQPLCKTYIQSIPQPSEKGKENPGLAPLPMPFHFEQLPDSLKASGRFCLWRYELRGGRQTKVPYDPVTKARARSNDPSSFSDYPTALRQRGYDDLGVGIFGALCAIDLDHCVTVTGNRANDFDIGDRSAELSQFLERYMRRDSAAGNAANAADASILRLVSTLPLWKGQYDRYPSHSEADLALLRELAVHTGCNAAQMDRLFRQSGLMREKWDRPQSGSTYGAISIEKAIALCRTPAVEAFPPVIPLTQSAASLPAFPIWCLPAPFAAYAEAVAQHSQTAVDMAGVIALGVLAVCFQGKYLVQGTPGYFEPLNLYIMLIAPPGERKSSVMREMTQCLYDYEQGLNQRLLPGIRQNQFQRASLQRKIEGLESKLKHKPNREEELELQSLQEELENLPEQKPVRFFADDCTSEALTNLLCANHGIFSVISTEGGIFDVMAGRYSNRVNIDTWLKAHCGDVIQVDRLTRGTEYIAHPALSAILTVQPSVLHEIMDNATLAGRGLVARFLYASPPSRIGARVFCAPPVLVALQQQYREAVFRFMALPIPAEPAVLVLSDRATAEIASYFSIHEQFLAGEGQEIADWASKYIGAILRIAGLLHAADMDDGASEIQAETVRRAIAIGKYFLAHSRYAYSVMGVDETIRKARVVVSKLQAEKAGTWKRNELFKLCRGKFFKKVEDILPTLELLESYIISFDPRDMDRAQALGVEFAKTQFPGHQALVCTHPDGHNHSGNLHVHIVINSLRIAEVPMLPYMERPADTKAGCKHRCTDAAMEYFKAELMELCHREQLHQVDLLHGAQERITEKEYWAKKRGQAKSPKFETDKEKLRQQLRAALEKATSLDELRLLLLQEGIEVRESRGRFSYLTPDRTKPITARRLGDNYEKAAVLDKLAQNVKRQPVQRLGRMIDIAAKRAEGKGVGYERWAKVHNLKQAAKAWNAFEASGYATPEELEAACEEARKEYRDVQAALRGVEEAIQAKKALQFHVLQYCKTKPLRQEWKALRTEKARINFRAQHESDLLLMEAAKRHFDQQGLKKLPSYKMLQQEIEALVQEKNQLYRRYLPAREKFRELDTMRHNLRQLLRQPAQDRQREVR